MKNYIAMKAAEKWSVQKETIDDQEVLQLVQNKFDSFTGEAIADVVLHYSLAAVAAERSNLADKIQALKDEDADWKAMETDLKKL